MADPLGDILGSPFKLIGGDLASQVLGRIGVGIAGGNPMQEPYPGFFKELSDELVRPGASAGSDFVQTYINPVGAFYDRKKGGYDFSAKKMNQEFGDPMSAGFNALSMVPGLKALRPIKRANMAVKKAALVKKVAPKVAPAAKPSIKSSFKTGYQDALERSLQTRTAGGK